jgi:hypothetical protein
LCRYDNQINLYASICKLRLDRTFGTRFVDSGSSALPPNTTLSVVQDAKAFSGVLVGRWKSCYPRL